MVNKERVKLMTKMASYENKEGKEDLKITEYYRKDYVSMNVLFTVIWITVGYAMMAGLILVINMEKLMNHLSVKMFLLLAGSIVGAYLFLIILYGVIAHDLYKKRHNRARKRVKQYNRDLARLTKMYEKEKM